MAKSNTTQEVWVYNDADYSGAFLILDHEPKLVFDRESQDFDEMYNITFPIKVGQARKFTIKQES